MVLGIEKDEGLPHSEIINEAVLLANMLFTVLQTTVNGEVALISAYLTYFEKVRLSGASSVCSKLHCSTRLRGQGSGMSSGWRDGKRRRTQTLVNVHKPNPEEFIIRIWCSSAKDYGNCCAPQAIDMRIKVVSGIQA